MIEIRVSHNGQIRTPEDARCAVRRLLAERPDYQGEIVVSFEPGIYQIRNTLFFDEEDSGNEKVSIIYRGEGETIFSSFCSMGEFFPEKNGLWKCSCSGFSPTQLFVNGERRERASIGKKTPYEVDKATEQVSRWANGELSYSEEDLDHNSFLFKEGDIPQELYDPQNVEVVVLQYWMESRMRIVKIDKKERRVHLQGRSWRPLDWSFGYYLDNVKEGLTEPGVWYFDRKEQAVYYHPQKGESLESVQIEAPCCQILMQFDGNTRKISNLKFENIIFEGSEWQLGEDGHSCMQAEITVPKGILANGLQNSYFSECEFRHFGGYALWLKKGCRGNVLENCKVWDMGAGFLMLGQEEDPKTLEEATSENTILNNEIRDCGQVYLGAAGIWIGQSAGNRIAHNDISGALQWAISVGWNWSIFPMTTARDNTVEYNRIHQLGNGILGTHGAIYFLGVQPGSAIRNNYISEVFSNPHWGGGEGIILDNGCAGIIVENNIVEAAEAGGYGSNFNCFGNIIINNIFIGGKKFQLTRYGDPPSKGRHPNGEIFSRNIVVWNEGPLFGEDDWWAYDTYWDYNLYFHENNPFLFLKYTFSQWQELGLDVHSVILDPLLYRSENGDLAISENSPVFQIGFHPISTEKIGLYKKGV